MNRRSIFGSHLYNQIVIPLLAASIVVGVVATVVAVYFLRDLTTKWVGQVAEANVTSVVSRYEQYAEQMRRFARFSADDELIHQALADGGEVGVRRALETENSSLGYDGLFVLDAKGEVLAGTGTLKVYAGARPLGPDAASTSSGAARPRTLFATVDERRTLTATCPIKVDGREYTLCLSRIISDDFLAELAGSTGSSYCFYGPDLIRVACTISKSGSADVREQLNTALTRPDPKVLTALRKVTDTKPGVSDLLLGSDRYQVWARKVQLPGNTGTEQYGYLVGVVSQTVSEQTARTTTNLITMWSIVAVVALVGLGGWVARRVSDPLVELADGARRIAEGDFSTKVHIGGANELATLAEGFNQMTDSLKDRSESLTKKVLELATLYEMSRALGSTLDMDELLGSVLDSALRIFDLDLGYVALREKETGALSIRAVRGRADHDSEAVRSSMSEWVVREGRPLIFNPDPGTGSGQIDTVTGARAALCVPLVSSEGTIGAITVGSSALDYRFNSDDVRLLSTIANHVTIAIGNIELFTSLQEAYLATVRSLAAAVDAKDTYTRGHSERVAGYATLIAERMGIAHEQRIALEMAAYLHDIGKIGVAEDILLKPGRLDDAEMVQMRHHPLIGANILKPVAFPWAITPVVRHHHEAYDGTGYPAGLKGEEIPLLARILTVADSYEAMTSDRPYRKGRSATDALDELRRCSGGQFDPRIVDTFGQIIEELERSGEGMFAESADDVAPEEARAIFSALVDGVFASFRRLGGPRLAANVEQEVDDFLVSEQMPFRISRGRLSFTAEAPFIIDDELVQMRTALRRIDTIMGRLSGSTLVDHFYSDALEGFSTRMRYIATVLDFHGPI